MSGILTKRNGLLILFFKFSPTVMFQSKVFENISFSMFSPTRIINFYISDSQNPRWYISIIFRGSRKKIKSKFAFKSLFALKIRHKIRGKSFWSTLIVFHQRQLIICIVFRKLTKFLVVVSSLKVIFENRTQILL